jgi:hypothetical protein
MLQGAIPLDGGEARRADSRLTGIYRETPHHSHCLSEASYTNLRRQISVSDISGHLRHLTLFVDLSAHCTFTGVLLIFCSGFGLTLPQSSARDSGQSIHLTCIRFFRPLRNSADLEKRITPCSVLFPDTGHLDLISRFWNATNVRKIRVNLLCTSGLTTSSARCRFCRGSVCSCRINLPASFYIYLEFQGLFSVGGTIDKDHPNTSLFVGEVIQGICAGTANSGRKLKWHCGDPM